MKRAVELKDILRYRFLSYPAFSPNGQFISFLVHEADPESDGYASNIWLVDLNTTTSRQLTYSGKEKAPTWKNDGQTLCFISGRRDGKKTETSLYELDVTGGEAKQLHTVPRTLSLLSFLPDDCMLALGIDEPACTNPYEGNMHVFEQIPFCSNGMGFTGHKKRLYLYSHNWEERQITPDDMDVENYVLSGDGRRVLAWGPRFKDVRGMYSALLEISLASGTVQELLPGTDFTCKWAGWTEDSIAFNGTDYSQYGVYENIKFYILKNSTQECITPDLDRGIRSCVGSDCRYGSRDLTHAFVVDKDRVWFVATEGYRSHLYVLKKDKTISQVTGELYSIDDWCVRDGMAAVVGMKGLQLQELFLVDGKEERQLTNFNDWVSRECLLSHPEHVVVDIGAGNSLDGWYLKPPLFEEGVKYPAILTIHGGPKAVFGDVFFHEMQYWAGQGYVVFYCNPRGSDGKGNAFDDIRGKYGTVDYNDIMAFTDRIVELPFVDEKNLGVTGGSYGGFMTNWIVGHTDRFKAAVAQRSICNWISMMGLSDIGYYFVPDQQDSSIWPDAEKLWRHSPLKYADAVRTPTLFIHSDEDHRCELAQGFQMFTALKLHGVETQICIFKGENHNLSRSGHIKSRLTRLWKITTWFDRFLKKQG